MICVFCLIMSSFCACCLVLDEFGNEIRRNMVDGKLSGFCQLIEVAEFSWRKSDARSN